MGKLNIAHHKSYHPYRRDNIERVRKDEEEAAQKEAEAEGRVVLADAEARLDLLRERAGLGKGKGKKKEDDMKVIEDAKASILAKDSNQGHINLFEDLEQQEMITSVRASKKATQLEAEKGVPLAPSAKDLNPWYSERDKGQESQEDEKYKRLRLRDLASKTMNDPLTAITHQLASGSSSNNSSPAPRPSWRHSRHRAPPESNDKMKPPPPPPSDATTMRLTRESSERERALALIRRKQREMRGSETPSTVHGGLDEGYGDVFNRREVEEAHSYRRRRW
ncbi:hypothetical protein EDD22DRAFT_883923 [Suillus occidentalis]|nr:hypothetical protein EDD22DRAFT_883923 [Suillus occidentalis]